MPNPLVIGITCDLADGRARVRTAYAEAVRRAGASPILLQPDPAALGAHLDICDAFVFTGGDDPATEPFGAPTHPEARLVDPVRQEYETLLLRTLAADQPDRPVLGVCLGMQMMALVAGGELNQHMPDDVPTHTDHWNDAPHAMSPLAGTDLIRPGVVKSHHRQAVRTPGGMRAIGHAPDGVIEAIDQPGRAFYLGVQWHPERTEDAALGQRLFNALVGATR